MTHHNNNILLILTHFASPPPLRAEKGRKRSTHHTTDPPTDPSPPPPGRNGVVPRVLRRGDRPAAPPGIVRTVRPNKVPGSLSLGLDGTLRDSHDLVAFGAGTMASLSGRGRYLRFTRAMLEAYGTMEEELDLCCRQSPSWTGAAGEEEEVPMAANPANPAVTHFWGRHGGVLRRSDRIRDDGELVLALTDSGEGFADLSPSPASISYSAAIREAGRRDRADGGVRLLGHAYTRYLADLMGGSVLASPTELALALPPGSVGAYSFAFPLGQDRGRYVGEVYGDLNEAGWMAAKGGREAAVEEAVAEARLAFRHNVRVYTEEPIAWGAVLGLGRIAGGWMLPPRR